jgi:hypothetical protein
MHASTLCHVHTVNVVLRISEQRTTNNTMAGGDWYSFHIAPCKVRSVRCIGYPRNEKCVIFILLVVNSHMQMLKMFVILCPSCQLSSS